MSLCARAAEVPKRVDVKQLSKKVEDVVVPLPNEVFGALNKLGGVNWREYVRNDKGANFTERPRIALLLGAVIADGFIAVQAEDTATVKDIGQRVLTLPSSTRVASLPTCWLVYVTGRPVDGLVSSCAIWAPASKNAPAQKGGSSAFTVPDDVAVCSVRGLDAVYEAAGAEPTPWQSVMKPLGCKARVDSPCHAFATTGW